MNLIKHFWAIDVSLYYFLDLFFLPVLAAGRILKMTPNKQKSSGIVFSYMSAFNGQFRISGLGLYM